MNRSHTFEFLVYQILSISFILTKSRVIIAGNYLSITTRVTNEYSSLTHLWRLESWLFTKSGSKTWKHVSRNSSQRFKKSKSLSLVFISQGNFFFLNEWYVLTDWYSYTTHIVQFNDLAGRLASETCYQQSYRQHVDLSNENRQGSIYFWYVHHLTDWKIP